jgi:2-polyprenyl-3-methyl-5-hydroxy-6-metoxy-1,4-benzoquinol methylase
LVTLWASPDLSKRIEQLELMDDPTIVGCELRDALSQLRWINQVLGAAWPTLEGVHTLWRQAGKPTKLSLIDVGAGTGDQNRLLLRWAARHACDLTITLVDIHPETCGHAQAYFGNEPRITVRVADLFDLAPTSADIVTASLVLHHIPTERLPEALRALRRAARLGVVINDLHRHQIAYWVIRWATRILSRNRMIRHDAPLSIRRGFVPAELKALQQERDLTQLRFYWRPLFRYLMLLPGADMTHV